MFYGNRSHHHLQPQNQTVPSGTAAFFSVTASGTQPLTYQWLFNGTNIGSATASSLMLSNVQAANAGLYSVVVSNLAGPTTSSNAVLTVNTPCLTPPSGLVSWWRAESNAFDQVALNHGTLYNGASMLRVKSGRLSLSTERTTISEFLTIPACTSQMLSRSKDGSIPLPQTVPLA